MTNVSVSGYRIPLGVIEYEVMSSNLYASTLGPDEWSPAIRGLVTNCRRSGASKGRVLYLLEGTQDKAVPVAVLAYHIESSKEIEIRGTESALALKDREADFVRVLLVCADEILRQHPSRQGKARLVWPVSKANVGGIRERYGFAVAGTAADGRQLLVRPTRGT
jgi:hypothetical protein